MMDDFTIVDGRLTGALDELRWVNVLLGGHAGTLAVLQPALRALRGRPVRVLDVGTGVADLPERLVRWATRAGVDLEVVGLDANPATVAYADATLTRRLPAELRQRIRLEVGDALDLPYETGAFDFVTAALFAHHFPDDVVVRLLRNMQRVGRRGLVVNDLHRHPLAYHSIRVLAGVLPVSPMFRHDGPLSVLRAFRREELAALALKAGIGPFTLRWRWAFRWVLSTVATGGNGR